MCLTRLPLLCRRHLPTWSLPLLSASPACLVATPFRSPSCLVAPSAVGATCDPLLPCHPLLLIACLPRLPLRCRCHPRPSTASLPAPFGHLRQAYSSVRRRSSLGLQQPFRARRGVGGSARWPPDSPSFSTRKSGRGTVLQKRRRACVHWTCTHAPPFLEQVTVAAFVTAYSGVSQRASLGHRWTFRSRRSIVGAARWPLHYQFFYPNHQHD